MTRDQESTYQTAIDYYGINNQMIKCIEECAELIQALAKRHTYVLNHENVIEEIADVQIMIHQMSMHYGHDEIKKMIHLKTLRLADKMNLEMAEAKHL